jgi:hypothetical protein
MNEKRFKKLIEVETSTATLEGNEALDKDRANISGENKKLNN